MSRCGAALMALCGAMISTSAHASITGEMNATITLTAACKINSATASDTTTGVNFGTIDFGSNNTYFTTADAQLVGTANGIALQCSKGVTSKITFGDGNNSTKGSSNTGTTGARAMKHSSEDNYVTYNLYKESARTTLISSETPIELGNDGTAKQVSVFGRAYGANSLDSGEYSDIVAVTIVFS